MSCDVKHSKRSRISNHAKMSAQCRHDMRPSAWLYLLAHCTVQPYYLTMTKKPTTTPTFDLFNWKLGHCRQFPRWESSHQFWFSHLCAMQPVQVREADRRTDGKRARPVMKPIRTAAR